MATIAAYADSLGKSRVEAVRQAIEHAEGDVKAAARSIGVHRATVHKFISMNPQADPRRINRASTNGR